MKTTLKFLSLAMLIPASLWAGNLGGKITNANGGATIPSALVVIRQGSTTAAVFDSVRSNDTGSYLFSTLPAATYYVTVTATGYVTVTNTASVVPPTGDQTSNFPLTPAVGTISGVARAGGFPLVGLVVTLYRGWGSATGTTIATGITDSTGFYSFNGVLSGTPNYYVTIYNPATNQRVVNGNLAVSTGGTLTSNFLLSTTALRAFLQSRGIHWMLSGDRLNLNLDASTSARTVYVFGMNGTIQYRVAVPAGESHATVPAKYSKGYLFQIR